MRDEKKVDLGNDKFPQTSLTFLESANDSAYNGYKDCPNLGKCTNSQNPSRRGERSKGRHWFDPEFGHSQVDCAQQEAAQTQERDYSKCHRQLQNPNNAGDISPETNCEVPAHYNFPTKSWNS